MCSICAGLFERMEYCEEHGLVRVGELVREALAEHGSRRHESDSTTKDAEDGITTKEHEGNEQETIDL